jgi:hypothetical protein
MRVKAEQAAPVAQPGRAATVVAAVRLKFWFPVTCAKQRSK